MYPENFPTKEEFLTWPEGAMCGYFNEPFWKYHEIGYSVKSIREMMIKIYDSKCQQSA